MKKLFLLLFISLISCIPVRINNLPRDQKPVFMTDIWVDSEFSESQAYLIEQAAEEWENATRGMVKIIVHKNYDIPNREIESDIDRNVVIKVSSADPFVIEQSNKHSGLIVNALTTKGPDLIHYWIVPVMDRITFSSYFRSIMIHELGHIIVNFGHMDEGPAIMNEVRNKFVKCLTEFDLKYFCTKYDCVIDEMNYCDPYDLRNQFSY